MRVTIRAQNTRPRFGKSGTTASVPRHHHLRSGVGLGPYASLGEAIRRIGRYMKAECVVIEE